LGDSLTSGHGIGAARAFPAVIQEKLTAAGYDFTVVNAGVSGDTSSQAVRRYQTALDDDVRIMILALGVNDGLRGLPIADLRRNLAAIIEHAQSRKIAVLLCGMEALPIYGWKYTLDFHQMYVELARTYDVPLVPFMMLNVLGKPELLQPDRVHPNAAGARVMAEHVWPYLAALLERVGASRVSV
jgi:acyl-CoA thioesterase-1